MLLLVSLAAAFLLSVPGCTSTTSHHAATPGATPRGVASVQAQPSPFGYVAAGDGVRLRVQSLGQGRVVLLVHGGPGLDLETLNVFNPLAGSNRRMVGYDQRGAGRSTPPADGNYGLDAQLRDLDAVRRWTGAQVVDLVGASWGGLLAAAYAARYPSHVRSLVLLDAAPLDLPAFEAGERRFGDRVKQLQHQGLVPTPLPADDHGSCLPSLNALLPVYLANPRQHLAGPVTTSCTSTTAKATFAALRRRHTLTDLAAALASFSSSALVVAGASDPFGSQWADRVAQLLPAARVTRLTVPAAGHIPYLERPQLVEPIIAKFLS